MNDKVKFTVKEIGNGVWNFNESDYLTNPLVDAYLICGSKKALLIDTLISECNLLDKIRKITALPLEVIVTHGHSDHAGKEAKILSDAGFKIHMNPIDCKVLNSKELNEATINIWEESVFDSVKDGMIFDLGDRQLEIISIPGHTPGSIVILDRENQILFSGDSIGSGMFWMQIPYTTTLVELLTGLRRLREKLTGLERVVIYPGHHQQSPVTLSMKYIDDVYEVTEKIISGSLVGNPITDPFAVRFPGYKTGKGLITDYCYDPTKIR